MRIEILATGNELCTGDLIDTNSAYIAARLRQLGLFIPRFQCVKDDLNELVATLTEISKRADILLVTGGLGPTLDDLSSLAAAKAAGKQLVLNQAAYQSVDDFLKQMQRSLTAENEKQAYLPAGATCLANALGSAPGFSCKINNCTCFFLPGVPQEMQAMLEKYVIPYITEQNAVDFYIAQRVFTLFGLAEAAINEKLMAIQALCPKVQFGTRASVPEIQVKLYATAATKQQAEQYLDDAAEYVLNRLGHWIFSSAASDMAEIIGDLLRKQNATLALAESCTGGLVANLITNVAGSSDYFLLSAVTYANTAKEKVLGVKAETLKQYGAVSAETVKEMAIQVRAKTNATYGLATSGIAGPAGGSAAKPIGTIYLGFASAEKVEAYRYFFPYGNRIQKKKIFAMAALDLLRRKLLNLPALAQK